MLPCSGGRQNAAGQITNLIFLFRRSRRSHLWRYITMKNLTMKNIIETLSLYGEYTNRMTR